MYHAYFESLFDYQMLRSYRRPYLVVFVSSDWTSRKDQITRGAGSDETVAHPARLRRLLGSQPRNALD